MTLEFTLATSNDKAYVLKLRKLTMTEHLEKAGLFLTDDEHKLQSDESFECCYLISLSEFTIGMIKYRELANKFEIMQLQIHPDYQNQGLGKTVVEEIINWSKAREKDIELTVLKDNPAKLLYERCGFTIFDEDEYEYHLLFEHAVA